MGIKMAVVDHVADALQPAAGPVQGGERGSPLRREGKAIDNRRIDLAFHGVPLMDVPVEDMGFLDAAVDDSELDRVACVVAAGPGRFSESKATAHMSFSFLQEDDVSRGITVHPGAVVLLLSVGRPLQRAVADETEDEGLPVA
jgi:hypothetical protein